MHMKEKAEHLIYLSPQSYLSYRQLKSQLWIFGFLSLLAAIFGIAAGKPFFPVSAGFLLAAYAICFAFLRSRRVRKTFPLRFLVNGIAALFLSAYAAVLFLCTAVAIRPALSGLVGAILALYLLFVAVYLLAVVIGTHRNVFRSIRQWNRLPLVRAFAALFSAVLPVAVALGINRGGILSDGRSEEALAFDLLLCGAALMFMCALGYINFIQYDCCRRYSFSCDEDGNPASPGLERPPGRRPAKEGHRGEQSRKKIPVPVRILAAVVCVPLGLFLVLFAVFLIKALIA